MPYHVPINNPMKGMNMLKRLISVMTLAILVMASTVSYAVAQDAAGGLVDGGAMGTLAVIAIVAQFLAKLIPDSTTGILGIIRQILKVAGVYTENRKT